MSGTSQRVYPARTFTRRPLTTTASLRICSAGTPASTNRSAYCFVLDLRQRLGDGLLQVAVGREAFEFDDEAEGKALAARAQQDVRPPIAGFRIGLNIIYLAQVGEQPEGEGVEDGFRVFAGIVITEEMLHQFLQQRFEARPVAVQ